MELLDQKCANCICVLRSLHCHSQSMGMKTEDLGEHLKVSFN